MMKQWMSGLLVCGLMIGVTAWAAEKKEIKLEGIKCAIAPTKDASAEKSTEYKEGKVFFCCDGCKGKFEKDKEKYATKANMQLVATKQFKQKACPLSGGDVDPEKKTKIGEVEVAFCCGNCQTKVAETKGDEQAELVFGEKAFEQAFEIVKPEDDQK